MTSKNFSKSKIATASLVALSCLSFFGCAKIAEEANNLKNDTLNQLNTFSSQIDQAKSQAIETKNKIETKVKQAQEAYDAVNKLTH